MSWLFLLLAGLLEIVWAALLKLANGFENKTLGALAVLAMIASVWFLALSMRTLPLGTAYTVWTGIGAFGAFIVGLVWFGEPATAGRITAAGLIIAGVCLMKLSSNA